MSKGQAILLDFVFAAFIFSIVFAAIMLSLRNIQDNLDYEEKVWRIQHAAIPAVDILVKSGGVPVDWELNPAQARIPALAGTGYGLSPVKVAALNNLDYEFVKQSLGLDGFEYKLVVQTIDGETVVSKGMREQGDFVVGTTRLAFYRGRIARVRLTVWEEENE